MTARTFGGATHSPRLRPARRWGLVVGLGLALASAACSGPTPLDPEPLAPVDAGRVLPGALVLHSLAQDANLRILPGLEPSAELAALQSAMANLASALETGLVVRIRAAYEPTQSAFAHYAAVVAGDEVAEAELDVVRLTLELVGFDLAQP